MDLETVKLLTDHLVPVIRDALRSEFDHLRRNYMQADTLIKEEFEEALKKISDDKDARIAALEARVKDLEATKWWVSVSYGGIVAFVTALWHASTKLPWKSWLSRFAGSN